jgi:hypothetical protein
MGRAGRRRVEDYFTWGHRFGRISELLGSVGPAARCGTGHPAVAEDEGEPCALPS